MLPKISNILSFAAGVAVGAGLEYLLDPDAGHKRRKHYSHALGDYVSDIGDRVRHLGEDAYGRASHTARAARDWTMSTQQHARKRAGGWLDMYRNGQHDHDSHLGAGAMLGTALGAMGIGALIMYAFDPQMGQRRRAMVRDQAIGRWNDAREYVSDVARDAAGHIQGYAHEARSVIQGDKPTDQQLEERIRSQLGHLTDQAAGIQVMVQDGVVTLRGNAPQGDRDKIEEGVRGVSGVRNVENELQSA